VRAPDRSGGDVGQQLGQLHVDLVELGRAALNNPTLTATYRFQAEPLANSMCRARRVV
jgi:hypothetical protein